MLRPKYDVIISHDTKDNPNILEVSIFSLESQPDLVSRISAIADSKGVKCILIDPETLRITWSKHYTLSQLVEAAVSSMDYSKITFIKVGMEKKDIDYFPSTPFLPAVQKLEKEGQSIVIGIQIREED